MRKSLIVLSIATTGLFSCGQGSKSTPDTVTVDKEKVESPEKFKSQNQPTTDNEKYIDTRYEYTDAEGRRLLIQNSLPKGGLKYTDTNGNDFLYAIFWTRITNEAVNPLELSIHFPADAFKLPSSADTYFKLLLPPETMTLENEPLFNYGLTSLESFLDNELHKSSSVQKTINPNSSTMFYVVTLFNKGVDGVVRAALSFKDQTVFYRVNEKEIACGQINFN
ncbi:hypothetical protein [Planktosalinus lacus]|uniref:Lipoprotein n=1 Tax=Planktosalinus lacus TaxID=1526573 RepID=A0A8J2V9E8_9FLAO|nr:hypothetical protein [Planktosalinus lacus]GGD89247.1 hypothetical protein GCM10011312_11380 [Planktosalinus lacus]